MILPPRNNLRQSQFQKKRENDKKEEIYIKRKYWYMLRRKREGWGYFTYNRSHPLRSGCRECRSCSVSNWSHELLHRHRSRGSSIKRNLPRQYLRYHHREGPNIRQLINLITIIDQNFWSSPIDVPTNRNVISEQDDIITTYRKLSIKISEISKCRLTLEALMHRSCLRHATGEPHQGLQASL